MSPWTTLIACVGLVLANAFFVASEFAIVKMRPSRLQELAAHGRRGARVALHVSQRLDTYLTAHQLGITLASLALGWLSESTMARLLEPVLADSTRWSTPVAHGVAAFVSLASISFLHIVLGELAPKSLALQSTEQVALWTTPVLRGFYVLMFPAIWMLNLSSRLVLRCAGMHRPRAEELRHTPEELQLILERVDLWPDARRLIDRVFDCSHMVVQEVMTPRRAVVVLDVERPWHETVARVMAMRYSRYPVIRGSTGVVEGYVLWKDIVEAVHAMPDCGLRHLVREPLHAALCEPLESLRRELQHTCIHLAVIHAADGSFAGIVTLDDVLAALVGELRDEHHFVAESW